MPAARITFVTDGLRCGGVERAALALVQGLKERGYSLSLVTLSSPANDFFSLPPDVPRLALKSATERAMTLLDAPTRAPARIERLRTLIEATNPDLVVAHAPQVNVPTLLAARSDRYPVIVTEHGDVAPRRWRKWLWYRLRRTTYARAAHVVSVSEAVDRNVAWLPPQRRAVIHNPFRIARLDVTSPPRSSQRPTIVSVGRLVHAKGHDVLLRAFERIACRFPQWQLRIVGEGELRPALQRQAATLADQVLFTGALRDPIPVLAGAQLFAMASRYEGFPMAHGEALMCGIPVIATDCPSRPRRGWLARPEPGGVRELVRHGLDGLLVPPENPDAFADALATCMSDEDLRARMAREARLGIQRFSLDKALDRWEEVFRKVRPS